MLKDKRQNYDRKKIKIIGYELGYRRLSASSSAFTSSYRKIKIIIIRTYLPILDAKNRVNQLLESETTVGMVYLFHLYSPLFFKYMFSSLVFPISGGHPEHLSHLKLL